MLRLRHNCVRMGLGAELAYSKCFFHVWGLRPHTCFTLSLRKLGPRTHSRHNFREIVLPSVLPFFALHLGMDYYKVYPGSRFARDFWAQRFIGGSDFRIPNCHEIALELVCGADCWCNRHCRTTPRRSRGVLGPSLAENQPKTRNIKIPNCQ